MLRSVPQRIVFSHVCTEPARKLGWPDSLGELAAPCEVVVEAEYVLRRFPSADNQMAITTIAGHRVTRFASGGDTLNLEHGLHCNCTVIGTV